MNRTLFLTTLTLAVSAFSRTAEWPTRASRSFSSNFGENRDDHFHMGIDIKTCLLYTSDAADELL